MKERNLGAIILAAGKGKRMESKKVNKVALSLADKPMIVHTLHLLQSIPIKTIIVVVGFAKNSVMKLLNGGVIFADQHKRLGTAHAVLAALKKVPLGVTDVLVLNGDDSAFYNKTTIKKLIDWHFKSEAAFTLLTTDTENTAGLGRIIRNKKGDIEAIIEEKDATLDQKMIKEINPACYIFKVDFLKKYLKKVKKSPVTGEYYLVSLIGIAIKNNEKIETHRILDLPWRGVNTKIELQEAEKLFAQIKK